MRWFGARAPRSSLRVGTAVVTLLSLTLLTVASDRMHNHPATEAALVSLSPSTPHLESPSSPLPAGSSRNVPCPACIHHRTCWLGPAATLPEGRMLAIVAPRRGVSPAPPPAAPAARPAGLRAPPLC